jgi:hypothetical protein
MPLEFLNARRAFHYRETFLGPDGKPHVHAEKVLADLRRFCRVDDSTFDPDPRIHALLEGRRETAQRILTFLNIDRAELVRFVEVQDE